MAEFTLPIVAIISVDRFGRAEYYKISRGGLGQCIIEIEIGAMQEMTKRSLCVFFEGKSQLSEMIAWTERYGDSKPFEDSFNLLERILLFGDRILKKISIDLRFSNDLTTTKIINLLYDTDYIRDMIFGARVHIDVLYYFLSRDISYYNTMSYHYRSVCNMSMLFEKRLVSQPQIFDIRLHKRIDLTITRDSDLTQFSIAA